ncbi:hypothetical protein IFM89_029128 [Coptis chinensis]|uniref:WRKY domain-containing protein n=1 Tax=Coptis chinensis TaxID=261450 RepID=A0A835M6V8_9MAGN|nr:hypothetical protein IFM89_029128 [Coptis chinensis]
MTVDLTMASEKDAFTSNMEENTVEEVTSATHQGTDNLIVLQDHPNTSVETEMDREVASDVAVNEFKRVNSLLGRTRKGHARFRRAPSLPSSSTLRHTQETNQHKELSPSRDNSAPTIQHLPPLVPPPHHQMRKDSSSRTISFSSPLVSASNTSTYSLTSATNAKKRSKSSSTQEDKILTKDKRRKLGVKEIVKIPAISSVMADIPTDDYSWRKYGQKPIKGSPHPRY